MSHIGRVRARYASNVYNQIIDEFVHQAGFALITFDEHGELFSAFAEESTPPPPKPRLEALATSPLSFSRPPDPNSEAD